VHLQGIAQSARELLSLSGDPEIVSSEEHSGPRSVTTEKCKLWARTAGKHPALTT